MLPEAEAQQIDIFVELRPERLWHEQAPVNMICFCSSISQAVGYNYGPGVEL